MDRLYTLCANDVVMTESKRYDKPVARRIQSVVMAGVTDASETMIRSSIRPSPNVAGLGRGPGHRAFKKMSALERNGPEVYGTLRDMTSLH